MKNTFRFDIIPLIMSLVFAGVWFVLGELMYSFLDGYIWKPLLIAIYITGLASFLLLSIIVSNAISKSARPKGSAYVKTVIIIAALFVCTMLFEFLYELDFIAVKTQSKPTSYVFLIDDSGSMDINDPTNKRYEAVKDVLDDCSGNFPVAIYSFGQNCVQVSPMVPASDAKNLTLSVPDSVNGGSTMIPNAIQTIIRDINSGAIKAGSAPRIILLADGDSHDRNYTNVIKECNNKNISISTVGFAGATDGDLKKLANETDGTYVRADNASDISSAMSSVATNVHTYDRDLLGYRPPSDNVVLPIIMRLVFMLLIGFGFVLIKIFMFNTFDKNNVALYTFIALAAVGSISIEIGINLIGNSQWFYFGYYEAIMRSVMCVFFVLLFGSTREVPQQNNYGYNYMSNNNWNSGGFGSTGSGFSGQGNNWGF